MTPREHELEEALRNLWGLMLMASMRTKNKYLQAAFRAADEECRKTGLMAREGYEFTKTDP